MREWEYSKIDLSQQRPGKDELEMLNAAGAHGWELVGITSNNIAYLKRKLVEVAPAPTVSAKDATSVGQDANVNGSVENGQRAQVAKVKYRDPITNETWSGRGRMATWLKRKQDAGEDIEKYLV